MIKAFADTGSRDIARGENSRAARRVLPVEFHERARIRLAALDAATSLDDLAAIPGWRMEKLKGDRAGQYSLRIDRQYRICWSWDGADADDVAIVDYH